MTRFAAPSVVKFGIVALTTLLSAAFRTSTSNLGRRTYFRVTCR